MAWRVRRMLVAAVAALTLVAVAIKGQPARAVDTRDTAFLHDPAIGGGRLMFVYADDLRPDGSKFEERHNRQAGGRAEAR